MSQLDSKTGSTETFTGKSLSPSVIRFFRTLFTAACLLPFPMHDRLNLNSVRISAHSESSLQEAQCLVNKLRRKITPSRILYINASVLFTRVETEYDQVEAYYKALEPAERETAVALIRLLQLMPDDELNSFVKYCSTALRLDEINLRLLLGKIARWDSVKSRHHDGNLRTANSF